MVSSIVKRNRSQSHEAPSFLSCSKMVPPYLSVHSQACFKNSSRVSSLLLIPSAFNLATTLASVAIEAWSVPGTQHALNPLRRARLMSTSWMVLFSICPICNIPVTLGGGITIV